MSVSIQKLKMMNMFSTLGSNLAVEGNCLAGMGKAITAVLTQDGCVRPFEGKVKSISSYLIFPEQVNK